MSEFRRATVEFATDRVGITGEEAEGLRVGVPVAEPGGADPLSVVEPDTLTKDVILRNVAANDTRTVEQTPRVVAAMMLRITDQESLMAASARLRANRLLADEAERLFNWTEIKKRMNEAKDLILKQERDVMRPLGEENRIISGKVNAYLKQEATAAEERKLLAQAQREREARAKEVLRDAAHQIEEHRVNEAAIIEHGERIERLMDATESREEQMILAQIPEPERIVLQREPVVMPAPERDRPAVVMPKGMSATPKYKGELYDAAGEKAALKKFLQAIIDDTISPEWVSIEYGLINKYANGVKPIGFRVPGMRCVQDFTVSQRRK